MRANELIVKLTSLVKDTGDYVVVNEHYCVVDPPWHNDSRIFLSFNNLDESEMDQEQAQKIVTDVVSGSLRELSGINSIAFYEIVTSARDRTHALCGYVRELKDLSLIQDIDERGVPQIHDSVRQAIVELVVGDGLDLRLK